MPVSRPPTMQVRLLVLLHIFGALCLCTGSVFNLVTHPLDVRNAAITMILFCLGTSLFIQELSIIISKQPPRRESWLDSYRARATLYLVAAVLMFDRLLGLPCDEVEASSASPPRAAPALAYEDPPTFGTAFYLSSSLSPICVPMHAVPHQDINSVAWVSTSVNSVSRALVFTISAIILAVSAVYFVLCLLQMCGKVGVSPSMSAGAPKHQQQQRQIDHSDVQDLEAHCSVTPRDGEGVVSSAYHLHPYADDRTFRSRSVDLFEENALEMADEIQCATPLSEHMSAKPPSIASTHHIGSCTAPIPAIVAAECLLSPVQGAASTPEQMLRNAHSDVMLAPLRAGSSDPHLATRIATVQKQQQQRYGYGYGYDYGPVDFASGCMMHYPLFPPKKKKARPNSPANGFPTLTPPDFSRSTTSNSTAAGLTPRVTGKARARVLSKSNAAQKETLVAEAQPRPTSNQRLGTSDSTTSTRPGTNASIHSARQRRGGLFAPLELNHHLVHSRLSAISVDASRGSCDSQRSCCSAGTFGDGNTSADDDDGPHPAPPTPRLELPHA